MTDQPDLSIRQIPGLGWQADLPDVRDYAVADILPVQPSPPRIDLEETLPILRTRLDQLRLGSCVGNEAAKIVQAARQIEGLDPWLPSRLWIYYYARLMEGAAGYDSGCQIRDAMKVLATAGAPPETLWPYDVTRFTQEPGPEAQAEAPNHRAVQYYRVAQDLVEIRACLAAGYPIIFGFTVYSSFMSQQVAQTGIMPMPGPGESAVGGHCVLLDGYDDANPARWGIVGNSWGEQWGDHGRFYMPADYLLNPDLCDDFWTVRLVS